MGEGQGPQGGKEALNPVRKDCSRSQGFKGSAKGVASALNVRKYEDDESG